MNVTSNGRSRHSFHRRRSSYNSKNKNNNNSNSSGKVKVLSGVTACLSGLDSDHKAELHAIIAHLGGEHSGVLDPAVVTHLVIDDTEGSVKYGWVQQILADDERDDDDMTRRWAKSLKIVTSAWIEACANEGRHVDENLYRLKQMKLGDQHENNHHHNGDHHFTTINDNNNTSAADDYYNVDNDDDGVNDDAYNAQIKLKSRSLPSEIDKNATLEEACDWFIRQQQQNDPYGVQQEQIFSMHSFLLVGFHMDSNNATAANTTTATSNKNGSDNTINNAINNIEGGGGGTTKSNNSNNNIDKHKRLHAKLSTLVRNAGGVIYWEPNELTTIVLINDDVDNIEYCDDFNQQQQQLHHRHQERTHMFQEARVYCQYHPRGPIAVTPRWILACLHHGMVLDFPSSFPSPPPIPIPMLPGPSKKRKSVMIVDDNNTKRKSKVALPNDKSSSKMKYKQSTIFQGDIFVVIRPQQLPSSLSSGTCLEYTQEDMENTITNAGGLILSKRILEAIKKDLARKRQQQQQQQQQAIQRRRRKTHNNNNNESESIENSNDKRRYFVVSSGGHSNLHHSKYHPLLGELTKSLQQSLLPTNGADKTDLSSVIEPVSPIWITSCIQEGYVYNPTQYPTLFQPQSYHLRLFPKETKFLVSVTGFVDASRYGIIWMLRSLGAEYTDNLKAKNTHLICCTSVNDENNNHNVVFGGAKYVKAQEWGLHVVTLDWLYHCMRYGYEEGCEDRFLAIRLEDKMGNFKKEERNSKDLTVRYSTDTANIAKEEAPSDKVALRTSTTKLEPKSDDDEEDDTANFDIDNDDDETTCLPPQMSTIKKEEMKSSDGPVGSSTTNESNENVRADPVAAKEDVIQTTTSRNSDDDYDAKTAYPSPHRGKRERKGPQASPVNNDSTKRFKSALHTLQSTPTVGTTTSSLSSRRRRGKRDRTPLSQSQLSQQSEESEGYSPEVETQFTIRADADIGKGRQEGFDDDNVPLSQENEALDNGESQVVWLPFMRR